MRTNYRTSLSTMNALVIDPDSSEVEKINSLIETSDVVNFNVYHSPSLEHYFEQHKDIHFDVAIINLKLPDSEPFHAIYEYRKLAGHAPIVGLSDTDDEIFTIASIQAGLQDCLVKNHYDSGSLVRSLMFAIERAQSLIMLDDRNKKNEEFFRTHDMLTGLPNAHYFMEQLNVKIKQSEKSAEKLAVLLLLFDGIRQVNLSMGLNFGDSLLQEISKILETFCQSQFNGAFISRYCGSRMAICIPYEDTNMLQESIDKLLIALKKPISIYQETILTSPTMGVSCYPQDTHSPDELIKYATMAERFAKKYHISHCCFYADTISDQSNRLYKLARDLHYSLNHHELFLEFQPKIHLATGKMVGVEALIRWNHPKLGVIPPSDFISLAEDSGMIVPITEWLIAECYNTYKKWSDKLGLSFPLKIAINIPTIELEQKEFLMQLLKIFDEDKGFKDVIEMEVTETSLMNNPTISLATLHELDSLGISIAIDDFGTGYSSLSYLKNLPVSVVKIDRSFIHELHKIPENYKIASATIDLVHNLNMTVVAEGAETFEEIECLKQMGCDIIQGYYFSRPISAEEILSCIDRNFLTEHN